MITTPVSLALYQVKPASPPLYLERIRGRLLFKSADFLENTYIFQEVSWQWYGIYTTSVPLILELPGLQKPVKASSGLTYLIGIRLSAGFKANCFVSFKAGWLTVRIWPVFKPANHL